jgi:hypothetical protein
MIAEFYKVLLTLYYISHLSCQRQLTTKWKLGFREMSGHEHLMKLHILYLICDNTDANLKTVEFCVRDSKQERL